MGNECTRLEKEKKKKMLVPQKGERLREGGTWVGVGVGGLNLEKKRIKLERRTQNRDPQRLRGRRGPKEKDRINKERIGPRRESQILERQSGRQ